MLRDSTQHLSGPLDYVVVKPIRVHWDVNEPGDERELEVGAIIPGEVAEAWPNRSINNLIWYDKVAPVPRGSVAGTEPGDLSGVSTEELQAELRKRKGRKPEAESAPAEGSDGSELVKLPGGFWELSDGSKVRGKNKAAAAQAELDAQTNASAEAV